MTHRLHLYAFGLAAATFLFVTGCEQLADEAGGDSKPAAASEAAAEGGETAELLKSMKELAEQRPEGSTREEVVAFIKETRPKIVDLADQALASKPLTEEQRVAALQAKWEALSLLMRVDAEGAREKFIEYAKSLANDKNEELAAQARRQVLTLRLMEVAAEESKPQQLDEVVADVKQHVNQGEAGPEDFELLQNAGMVLEQAENFDAAKEIYDLMGSQFANSDNPRLQSMATSMSEAAEKRLNLVGNTLDLEGTTLEDEEFDWSKYRGKVVLVDFWATWCGPCVEEIPNVLENYKKYHDQGFEVVGVSLDTDKESVEEFYEKMDIPWPTIISPGENSPMADRYGIMAIPATVLVGRDGKVITLRARGEELGKRLESLLSDDKSADSVSAVDAQRGSEQ